MSDKATILGEGDIRFERLLPGPIETVWEFLVDGRKRGEWLAQGRPAPPAAVAALAGRPA